MRFKGNAGIEYKNGTNKEMNGLNNKDVCNENENVVKDKGKLMSA